MEKHYQKIKAHFDKMGVKYKIDFLGTREIKVSLPPEHTIEIEDLALLNNSFVKSFKIGALNECLCIYLNYGYEK